MLRVEFTVEPFIEGQPGPHVLAAVSAVRALGFAVEFGPFASEFTGEDVLVATAIESLIREAYAHGASRVSVHVEQLGSGGSL